MANVLYIADIVPVEEQELEYVYAYICGTSEHIIPEIEAARATRLKLILSIPTNKSKRRDLPLDLAEKLIAQREILFSGRPIGIYKLHDDNSVLRYRSFSSKELQENSNPGVRYCVRIRGSELEKVCTENNWPH